MEANKITLQSILQQGYHVYERHHPLPGDVRRAVQAILACRTARLGGHVQACPEGHLERVWYNSCRHRMCPQCAWLQVERWLIKQKARLLACEHYHVIFTIPRELHELWLADVAVMTNILFAAEFIGRYLRHVPTPGSRVVRAYGLSAPTNGEALAVCREQVGQGPVVKPVVLDWQTACSQQGTAHPERGPVCGQRLVCRDLIPRLRIPPPAQVSAAVAA